MAGELTQALEGYRSADPAQWVALYRVLPVWAGLAFCALGAGLWTLGSTRAIRFLTVPLGAAVGVWAVPAYLLRLDIAPPQGAWTWGPAAAFALVGLASPVALFFFAVGLPAGLVASELAGRSDAMLGLIAGTAIGGAIAALLWRRLAALLSSAAGAWLFLIGLLSAVHPFLPSLGTQAMAHPLALPIATGILTIAGTTYQLSRPSLEEAARERSSKRAARQRSQERSEIEKKWTGGARGS